MSPFFDKMKHLLIADSIFKRATIYCQWLQTVSKPPRSLLSSSLANCFIAFKHTFCDSHYEQCSKIEDRVKAFCVPLNISRSR